MPLSAVLEQLFEDLNSYSETSINLDGFNSLELKLFPFLREFSHLFDLGLLLYRGTSLSGTEGEDAGHC